LAIRKKASAKKVRRNDLSYYYYILLLKFMTGCLKKTNYTNKVSTCT